MLTEKTIKKHVAIIHAYSLMSALQRKIVNVLLYEVINTPNIAHQHSVAVECRISFANLAKAVNFNSKNTQYLKEAIDKLASLKIEWNLLKDKVPSEVSFLNLRVLHGAPTFYHDGTFNFSFHKIMRDLLNYPAVYGTIDIDLQSQFESKYSHSLYENSTRFANLQKNKVISLDTFRKLLGLHEEKYTSMREFTRNVIIPSVEEVNDRADFIVGLESIKLGRKITGFNLSVKNKQRCQEPQQGIGMTVDVKSALCKQIKENFGLLNEFILTNILKNYGENYIIEKIAYVKNYAKKERSGYYPIPYFMRALKDDYKPAFPIKEVQVKSDESGVPDTEKQWVQKLALLQSDLMTWKKNLDHSKANNNLSIARDISKIIKECEEKLHQHLLEKPVQKGRGD